MAQAVNENWPFVVNLGNSIIGVAVLAMPFCFKQCGILLGMVVLLFCTWLTLASCQLLVKAGIVSHHRSYEFLAYHTYGAPGKFLVEIGMIGMQLGTLVAQIVVIGDLGPPIVSILLGVENNAHTRVYLMVFLCLAVGLPLGLMKDLRNVSRASTICITFYTVFIVYVLLKSSSNLVSAEWYSHVQFWRPQGLFQCLPIMSFSFGCQTQLFILYDALPDPSLHAIKSIIHSAVNLCAVAYLLVGFFGYVAFYEADIPGDIITVFAPTLASHLIKMGFVMSIAITFPVIIYPCRASIYTLLFQKKSKLSDDVTSTYIPEFLFRSITVAIVLGSMITGILIPNVEFILGLNGAITGTLICYIFPALFFLRVMSSKAEGKIIAQIVLVLGVSILLVSTFTTLYAQDKGHVHEDVQKTVQEAADKLNLQNDKNPHIDSDRKDSIVQPPVEKDPDLKFKDGNERRMEPPNPDAPAPDEKVVEAPAKLNQEKIIKKEGDSEKEIGKRGDSAGDTEKKEKGKEGEVQEKRQEKLLNALESQRKEQEKLLNEQKALLKELQSHKDQHHQDAQQRAAGQQGQGLQQGQGQVQGQRESGQIQQQHGAAQEAQPQQKIGLQQAQIQHGVLQQGAVGQQAQVNQQGAQPQVLPANNPVLNNPNQGFLGNNGQMVNLQNLAVNNEPQQWNLQNQNAALNNPAQAVGQNVGLNNVAQANPQNVGLNNQAQQPIPQNAVANNVNQQQAVQNAPLVDQPQGPAVLPAMQANAGGGGNLLQQNNLVNNPGQQQGGQNQLVNNPGLNPPVNNLGLNAPINNPAQPAAQNVPMGNILQDSVHKPDRQFAQNAAANNQVPMPQDKQQALGGVGVGQGMAPQAAGIQADKVQALGLQNGDLVGAAVAAADLKQREEGAGDDHLGDKELLRKRREAGQEPGHSAAEHSDMVHAVLHYMKEGAKNSAHPLADPQKAASDSKLLPEEAKAKEDVKVDNIVEMEGKAETDKDNKTDGKKNSPVEGKAGEEQPVGGAGAHKQEMRKLKAVSEEQGGHFGAAFEGGDDLEVKSFLHSARQGVLIRSLKSKGR